MKILKKLTKKTILIILAVIVLGVPLLYLSFLNANKARADWYNGGSGGWGYRKMLTIDRSKVSTTGESDTTKLSNFPVLVSVDDISLKKAQSTGNDILFTDSTGTVKLDHEIESFTQSTGTLRAWVRIPTILLASDTIIYMYYGNSSAASQQNATGVWAEGQSTCNASNFKGVWHLKETPTGSAGDITDSTYCANNGQSSGMNSANQVTSKVNGGLNFGGDSSGDYIDVSSATLNISSNITLSAWVKFSASQSNKPIISRWESNDSYILWINTTNNKPSFCIRVSSTNKCASASNTTYNDGSWHLLTGSFDGSNVRLRIDGGNTENITGDATAGPIDSLASDVNIVSYSNCSGANCFQGMIDEARIASTARSAGWITTEYNNQNSPSTFYKTVGSEEKSKGPVLFLKFDDPSASSGLVARDSSPSHNDGTLGVGTSSPTWTNNDLCVSGKCLQFYGGSNSTVGIGSTTPNIQSVGFWVKPKSTTEPMALLDGGTHNISATGAVISANGFDTPLIYVNGKRSTTLTANSWQYIEVTTGTAFSSASMKVGTNGSTYLNGFIDEFKVYDYARSSAEILADYNARGSQIGTSLQVGTGPPFLSQGLLGYWKLNDNVSSEGQTVVDSSGNGHSGTLYGNNGVGDNGTGMDCTVAGKFSKGCQFDGTDDYISASSVFPAVVLTSFTTSFWVYPTNLTGQKNYIEAGNPSYYMLSIGTDLWAGINGVYAKTGSGGISLNTWQHFTMTWDGATIRLYKNGIQVASTARTYTSYQNVNLVISNTSSYANASTMNEVRVYNRALSGKEVRDLYNFAPGPVGYWKMDEGSWTTDCSTASVIDSSGNGNNGKACPNSTGPIGGATGKYGKASSFDGSNDYVDVISTDPLKIQNTITLEAWVKGPISSGSYPTILQKSSNIDYGLRTENASGNRVGFIINSSTVAYSNYGSISDNTWVHVAGTYDGTNVRIYINGKLDKLTNIGSVLINTSNDNLALGRAGNGSWNYWSGSIDDVKIYNYARTAKQIVEDMQGRSTGSVTGSAVSTKTPLIYLKIDEGQGGTANNSGSGGTGKNGTINTGTWTDGKFGKGVNITGNSGSNVSIPDFAY